MYKISVDNKKIDILFLDKKIIEAIQPEMHIYPDKVIYPDLMDFSSINCGEYETIYELAYFDEESLLKCKLTIKAGKDSLRVYIQCSTYCEMFKRTQCLETFGGIRLKSKGLGNIKGLLASYLFKEWWARPYFNSETVANLPQRTQSLLWFDGDRYFSIIPVCDGEYKTELQGNGDGIDFIVSSYAGGYSECNTLAFAVTGGVDAFSSYEGTVKSIMKEIKHDKGGRNDRSYPYMLEYLGWCSWDAFYQEVCEKGLLEKADEFNKLGLPVKWFMIDDGWFKAKDKSIMLSLEEDAEKFPQGLKWLVEELKEKYGVKWTGVWHTLTAHWHGVEKNSQLAEDMKEYLYSSKNGKLIPYPDAVKGFGFWNAWHEYLKKQGIEFVKVDNQGFLLDFTLGNMSIGEAAKGAHIALEASVALHFGGCIMNCAGMPLENYWNRSISQISRFSEDFFPNVKDSFKEFIMQNVYNSVFHAPFSWGDWDMWWTHHEYALNNSVLRAVSGGPVYVSDPAGCTKPEFLWPLILSDGKILRCDRPGLPTRDVLVRNPQTERIPLKVWNTAAGNGIIAAFNVNLSGVTIEGRISPSEIPEIDGQKFAVYDYFKKSAVIVLKDENIKFSLDENQVKLFILVPIKDQIAYLGLINKYISTATIEDVFHDEDKDVILLKEGGEFGFVSERAVLYVKMKGKDIPLLNKNGYYIADCGASKEKLLIEIGYEK